MLQIPESIYKQMIAEARAGAPEEVCGILGGKDEQVTGIYPARNNARNPIVTYNLDPHEQLRIFRELDERGEEVIAIYHSHPVSPAYPSRTDVQLAFYPDSYYLIISLEFPDKPVLRAFRIVGEQIEEAEIQVIESSTPPVSTIS